MAGDESFHAIYLVLNDFTLFPASLRSVYPHITGATVITSYDRDRYGTPVTPDATVGAVLSRDLDPDRKVNVIVSTEGAEASLRNRAMTFAAAAARGARIRDQGADVLAMPDPDVFWIIDADELYDDGDIRRFKDFVRTHRAPVYWCGSYSYWRSWNWRIAERSERVIAVRPGQWFEHLRHPHLRPFARLVRKLRHLRALPAGAAGPFVGARIPREVAVFHHGDWIGDRTRIEGKLVTSGHRGQFQDDWVERVWDQWTPSMRNLHPFEPEMFPCAAHVATSDLPSAIRDHQWPDGWLEPA